MFIVYMIVFAVLGVANGFRRRPAPPEKDFGSKIAEYSSLLIGPGLIIFSVFIITIFVLLTLWEQRKLRQTPDQVLESLSELERKAATLLERQNRLEEENKKEVFTNATQASQRLVKREEAAKKWRKVMDSALLNQVQEQAKLVGSITKAVDERAAGEKVRDKERKSKVQELLNEWANWKKTNGCEELKKMLPEEYMNLLKDRRNKTLFPKKLKMSLPTTSSKELDKTM